MPQAAWNLIVAGELVSQPYVEMTLAVMAAFGVDASRPRGLRRFLVPGRPGVIAACRYAIEPDASAASYFFAAAAITGGEVTVEGLAARACRATWPSAIAWSRWAARSATADDRSPSRPAGRCAASRST